MTREPGGFEDWVAGHGDLIARIASSYERRPALIEELVQDVLIALWRGRSSFRGEASVRTFIARVAHNVCVTHVRRADKAPHEPLDDTLPDPAPPPEQGADTTARRERLLAAVRALPLSLRQAMTLHLEGFSGPEIGATLSISENNVNVRLARARRSLQQAMREPQP